MQASAARMSRICSSLPSTTVATFAARRAAAAAARSNVAFSACSTPSILLRGREPVGDQLRHGLREVAMRCARRHEQRVSRDRRTAVDPGLRAVLPEDRPGLGPRARRSTRRRSVRRPRRTPPWRTRTARTGSFRVHSGRPVAASRAAITPVPSSGGRWSTGTVFTALSRMHSSTTGTNTRPSAYAIGVRAPPKRPGHTSTGVSGSGPTSLRCVPTACVQTRSCVSRSQAKMCPPFPPPITRSRPSTVARMGESWRS